MTHLQSQHGNEAKWIWYPGDFEIWLGNRFNNLRTERGAISPTFWKQDSHYPMVEFSTKIKLEQEEEIEIYVEGEYNVAIDGEKLFGMPQKAVVPSGHHDINIKVVNQATPPALLIRGNTIKTNSSWLVTFEDKIWIDENGQAHGSGVYVKAGCWNFTDPLSPPSQFHLTVEPQKAIESRVLDDGMLYDFGRETIGYLIFHNIKGKGKIHIYYGESPEEAQDSAHCETLDILQVAEDGLITDLGHNLTKKIAQGGDYQLTFSKAFRYVKLTFEQDTSISHLSMLYEYMPEKKLGTFRCNDDELNKIWDVAEYTLQLTTREFFMDGIKRDRWVWSGDAVQSFLMNYYLFFDLECVKRTIRLLRGKDPVTAHINTIMDYTFYWFNGIYDYYLYSGDKDFLNEMYPKMQTLMDYCLKRTDENGMAEGQADDWIFVDWVDFPMHKRGVMCFEQILFCKALETMALCASLVGDNLNDYAQKAEHLYKMFTKTFWSEEHHAFLHNLEDGRLNEMITKFPNMFALLYGYADKKRRDEIMKNVMLNKKVEAITTPYMRFYELETLCQAEMQNEVLSEIKSYWGGMLRQGATSFWEKYIPTETARQHLAMYGRPYGKSLCHAWGASPIYLLGKYYLGAKPTKPGYEEYEICPHLGTLQWMKGTVPTPWGNIHIEMNRHQISILSNGGQGILKIRKQEIKINPNEKVIIDY